MTWSREDIIADIKECEYDIDITLPYWELRREYRRTLYRKAYLGSGSFGFAQQMRQSAPSPANKKVK